MPSFPYLAKATIKYKSPHKQDLTFAKGEIIRVTGIAPKTDPSDDDDDDDDDWLVGETLDGSRSGFFPGGFVEPTDEVDEAPSHEAEAKVAEATSAPSAPGAIPIDAPTDLQTSVVEEEPSSHSADVVPEAAREAAKRGETEEAGFGAPLPPRPPSPNAEEEETPSDPVPEVKESGMGATNAAAGAAAVGAAAGVAGAVGASSAKDITSTEASSRTATAEPAAATSPTKAPPAVATKPIGMSNSFRDRLAAFNKPAEAAPPPLPKGKPGGWKRPTPTSNEAKPILPGASATAPASAAPKPAPVAPSTDTIEAPTSSDPSAASGGFSAADAQTSIKMSLKERMAALQRNEAAASDAAPQIKPKPAVPGKIGADRRNVALQGMGLAPGGAVPPRKSSTDGTKDADELASETTATQDGSEPAPITTPSEEAGDPAAATANEAGAADETQEQVEDAGEPKEELTEEEQEAERRAAIAKRMAALGARRMGGGPSPFGAPKPPVRTNTASSTGSGVGSTSEPGISIPTAAATSSNEEAGDAAAAPALSTSDAGDAELRSPISAGAEEEPKVLAVPRRTAAPRKRKPVAPAAEAATGAAVGAVGGAAIAEESDNADTVITPSAVEPEAVEQQSAPVGLTDTSTTATLEEKDTVAESTDRDVGMAAVGSADAQDTQAASMHEDEVSQQLDDEDPEIAENQRQLEEYLRGEGFYEDQTEQTAQQEPEVGSAAVTTDTDLSTTARDTEASQAAESVPREEVASPKPPSRPPSTRPPIPKTTLPSTPGTTADEDYVPAASLSRRGSAIPPVPTSSLPVPVETTAEETEESDEPFTAAHEAEEQTGPVLAAPRPRMAVATEDPEDEELLAAADAPSSAVDDETAPSEAIPQEQPEEQELTEEEQESQRRANLARRMAALGGQRIGAFPGMAPPPIMGAPMPARRAPVQAAEEVEDESTGADGTAEPEEEDTPVSPIRGPPRGGMAIPGLTAVPGMNASHAESDALERARSPGPASVDAPARLASPPPVPTSPPPKPMSPPPAGALPPAGDSTAAPMLPPGRPSSTVPMANLDEAIRSASPAGSNLARRGSTKPPIPQGISAHSRKSSVAEERSSASYASMGGSDQPDLPPVPSTTTTPATEQPPRTEAALPPTPSTPNANIGARHSSRDLDLMPTSRWWRHGMNPLRLPPTVAGRPDAILYADTSSADGVHRADIYMLFEDYSTTTISLSFQDDDAEESQTSLTQRHNFPPPKPSAAQLKQWAASLGVSVARLASDVAKQTNSPIGDGSPRAFVGHVLSQLPALPPVGTSLGTPVLTQVGATLMDPPTDEVRPGDLVWCSHADFRGKKGLAPYHTTLGTTDPTVGVVVEVESKKNKLRCVIQSPAQKKGAAEEVSLRMDDLKSGVVKVFRVPPRQGWVAEW
uniref:SH3 domain-containing protein n=1 Tax=Kalmanozyma brasiliensis (strain GHG001) TaxID=1365824 RepID=V5E7Y2_KALBG